MKIRSIVKFSVTEDDAINIKGGINSLNSSIESSCTDCNCSCLPILRHQSRFYEHIVFAETKVIKELVYGFHVVVFVQVLAEILHCAEFAAWIK